MSRNDRWIRIAEALADERFDDALEDIVEPIFGDIPPRSLVQKQFDHPRQYRLWHCRMEKRWKPWLSKQKLPEIDQFFINRELSNVYKLKFRSKRPSRRRKAAAGA